MLTLSLLVATFVVYILISFANSLDSDQDGQNFGSDLDSNHLSLKVFMKEFVEKVFHEKSHGLQQKHEKLRTKLLAIQRLDEAYWSAGQR